MTDDSNPQAIVDQEHLKLLSIFYMVSAGLSAFYSFIGLAYAMMGLLFIEISSKLRNTGGRNNAAPPAALGWILGGFGLAFFLILVALAALKLRTAFCIKGRKSRALCLATAVISCLEIPYGTLLGVFTFLVLDRASVRSEFAKPPA
jgi:hypothetical protein